MEAKTYVEWYFERVEEEMHLETSSDVQMFLKEAFCALRKYQRPIKFITTTEPSRNVLFSHSNKRESRPQFEKFLSFSKIAYAQHGDLTPILRVFEAALEAGCHIQACEVRSDAECHKLVHLSQAGSKALSCLRRLAIDTSGSIPSGNTDTTVETMVSGAKRLERLVLSSDTEYAKKSWNLSLYVYRLMTVLESHALRQIWLREIVVYPKGLLFMLGKHKDTLKELTISNVLLIGPWDKILLSIKDELRLDKLVMINLSTVDFHEFHDDFEIEDAGIDIDGGIELNGSEQVMSGIDEVFSRWNRERVDPDYKPSWRSAIEMGHLAYPED